jgi:hypothetical protein
MKEMISEAEKFLELSSQYAETAIQKVIALSNQGALAYARDDFTLSAECYSQAFKLLDANRADNPELEEMRIVLLENQKNMEIREAASRDEFLSPDPINLKEDDLEHAERMRNIALHYLTNEVYDENLRGRNSSRVSNNLYESIRYGLSQAQMSR